MVESHFRHEDENALRHLMRAHYVYNFRMSMGVDCISM